LENECFTINHIHSSFIEQAHYTSAKFEAKDSEFDKCNLTEEYLANFSAPFVKESNLKLGLKLVETTPIKTTNTVMIIGEIQHLIIPDAAMDDRGYINLEQMDGIGISGLNCYYSLNKISEFPYARRLEVPNW
jgi:flavin reductase (DIM6/NTAB) family NADH-FMN oxidoreductase RutF